MLSLHPTNLKSIMKKFMLLAVTAFILTAASPIPFSNVYICNGSKSTKYHLTDDCRGLNRCSTAIEKVTLKEAQDKGRTICGFED